MMKISTLKRTVAVALTVSTLLSSAPAKADSEGIGTILGGVVGGIIGHQFGQGSGRDAATVAGAIIGGMIGNGIGRDMDEADRRAMYEARQRALAENRAYGWGGRQSRSGAYGEIRPVREVWHRGSESRRCREYSSVIQINGGTETRTGYACSDQYGNWEEVDQTDIVTSRRYGNAVETTRETTRREARGSSYSPYPPPAPFPPSAPVPAPPMRILDPRSFHDMRVAVGSTYHDLDRTDTLIQYASHYGSYGFFLSLGQVRDLLLSYRREANRIDALVQLRPWIVVGNTDGVAVEDVVRIFRFPSDQRTAYDVLVR